MDNQKTGALIRRLRKERNMTQKDLADRLHVTDRAVSKWERGVGAPDLALLEPLAQALGITVTELLAGEQDTSLPPDAADPQAVTQLLEYSAQELDTTRKKARCKRRQLAAVFLLVLVLACVFLWWKGVFHITGTARSPDGTWQQTIYRFNAADRFDRRDAFTIRTQHTADSLFYLTSYGGRFEHIWWAPDSRKYVTAMTTAEGTRLVLTWLEHSSSSNLNAYLSMGVTESELAQYGFAPAGDAFPAIDYQFLQWAADSQSMLIYYAFEDTQSILHTGYFWYNCITGAINATLELAPQT